MSTVADPYVKRIRERMRRRGYKLADVYKPEAGSSGVWAWWWVDVISHKAAYGPYASQRQACETVERQGIASSAAIAGGVA